MNHNPGGPPQQVGEILEEVLSQRGYYTLCKEYAIVDKWPAIAGPVFAAVTKCEKIENGSMYVKVSSASWRQEAIYIKEKILARIHTEFKCPTIRDIVFY